MFRQITFAIAMAVTMAGFVSGAAAPFSDGKVPQSGAVEIELTDIETALVPTRVLRGDREFGGNGPLINCRVRLKVSPNRRHIIALVYFHAKETKSDWSTTEARWERTVFTAPPGKRIARIAGQADSWVSFLSKKAGFQILGPGEDFKALALALGRIVAKVLDAEKAVSGRPKDSQAVRKARNFLGALDRGVAGLNFQGNYVHIVRPAEGGPVSIFAIVGDTGGDDISDDNNPKDDTRIQAIKFNKIRVQYE